MITRQAQRFKVRLPVDFSGDREGTGVVQDLSIRGCRLVSRTPLTVGQSLSLTLYQGQGRDPISIRTAQVRWKDEWTAGLSFQAMHAESQLRLLVENAQPL